jgi:integrase
MSVRKAISHGRKVWQARVFYHGRRRSVYCASKDEARDAERRILDDLRAEEAAQTVAEQAPATIRTLLDFYETDLGRRGKGPDTIERAASTRKALEALTPAVLDVPLTSFTDRDVFAFARARAAAGAKPGTLNRDLRTLRAALKLGRPDYRFPGKAFAPADDTRVRWLRPEEELLVLEPMPSPFREIAKLAALTLMRQGERRTLRPEYIRLEQGVVLLPRAKGGARAVVLNAEAQKILRTQMEKHPDAVWVFPNGDGEPYSRIHVSRVFRKAARRAGLRDFRFHDLRHHGATMALNAGFTAPVVMALGGWKSEAMMRRYAAVTDATLRRAAEAVSGAESQALVGGRR